MIELLQSVIHPYPRYGLGIALYRKRLQVDQLDEPALKLLLSEAIESGLEEFRMKTSDAPSTSEILRYEAIKLSDLEQDSTQVQSSGLAAKGVYLYPSIISTDGDAKGTFDNCLDIIKNLRQGKSLISPRSLSRSFAPTTAKINNGETRSFSEPRGTLLEAACSAITTVTPEKPSGWIEGRNTSIIPDLSLEDLYDFIELFAMMRTSTLDGNLKEAKLFHKAQSSQTKPKSALKKSGEQSKSEYRRPRLHNGNYPFAPQRDAAAFGAVGLLGAIGQWSVKAEQTPWAERVLKTLVDKPLYIVSYDSISQVQFGHHIVGLAKNGKLSDIIRSLTYETRLGKEIDGGKPLWDDSNRRIFHLMAGRFLELFTPPAFQDFLAFRTEYPNDVKPLFQEYFMQTYPVPDELRRIIQGAEEYGRWLNYTAYRTARTELEKEGKKKVEGLSQAEQKVFWEKLKKEKAKIITVLESVAMSAKSGTAMIAQVSSQAGRLGQTDAPDEAQPFLFAAASDQINLNDARQLLMVYMRLQSPRERKAAPAEDAENPKAAAELNSTDETTSTSDTGETNGD